MADLSGIGSVDSSAPVGEDIHADNGETDLWGSDEPSNQSSTMAPAVPSAPAGDYDYDDPALVESETTAVDDAADDDRGGVGVTDSSRKPVGEEYRPEQLIRANQLGFTAEEMAELGSARALETALRREERLRSSIQTQQQQQQRPAVNPFDYFANPANIVAAAAPALKPKLDRAALLEKGFDDGMISAMETMLEANAKQTVEAMSQQFGPAFANAAGLHKWAVDFSGAVAKDAQQREQREQQAQVNAWNKEFDGHIAKLPEEWQQHVSKGDTKKDIHTACGVLAQSFIGLGQKVPDGEALVKMAIQMKLGNKVESVARDQVRRDVERRNQRGIARARSGGQQAAQSGDQTAIAFWNRSVSGKARRN